MKIELAIKFGSNEIIIGRKGLGIIAREPSYVAINRNTKKVCAYGAEAKRLQQLKPLQYELFEPIQGIEVKDSKLASKLVEYILNNAVMENGKIVALVAVPCALTEKKLLELKLILNHAGVSTVTFVQNSVCVRINLPNETDNIMVVDMGKYLLDISVSSKHEFVMGRNYLIGGAEMDEALVTYIKDNFEVAISKELSEEIKNDIASLHDNDMYTCTFKGINEANEYVDVTMRAGEARVAIVGIYDKMFDLIEESLDSLHSNLLAEVKSKGIVFTGGVSSINGMVEYATKRLELPVYVVDNPKDAVILGAIKLLNLNKKEYPHINL